MQYTPSSKQLPTPNAVTPSVVELSSDQFTKYTYSRFVSVSGLSEHHMYVTMCNKFFLCDQLSSIPGGPWNLPQSSACKQIGFNVKLKRFTNVGVRWFPRMLYWPACVVLADFFYIGRLFPVLADSVLYWPTFWILICTAWGQCFCRLVNSNRRNRKERISR